MENARFDRMNLMILSLQVIAWAGTLWLVEHTDNPILLALELYLFCLFMQGVFSMMHEGFHGHAHRTPAINTFVTWLASTLFGASSTFIRINHIGHHYRNRTEAEMVDYVMPGESRAIKSIAYYLGIFGGIWLGASIGSLVLAVAPSSLLKFLKRKSASNTYAAAIADFEPEHFRAIRMEVLASVFLIVCVAWLLDLSWETFALAYTAFAFSWSSLQWIYHVRTPLDVVEGTYNLRASFLIRTLFLNFNYNLTHHRDPGVRWQMLHKISDLRETRPFWYTWLRIVKPPEPLPGDTHFEKSYY